MREPRHRIITVNPETREKEVFTSHGDGTYTIEQSQDVEPILEANKMRLKEYRPSAQRNAEWRLERRTPISWLLQLRRETGLDFLNPDDWKVIKKKYLDTSEYSKFRVTGNRI